MVNSDTTLPINICLIIWSQHATTEKAWIDRTFTAIVPLFGTYGGSEIEESSDNRLPLGNLTYVVNRDIEMWGKYLRSYEKLKLEFALYNLIL
jgi:hypothetical protein